MLPPLRHQQVPSTGAPGGPESPHGAYAGAVREHRDGPFFVNVWIHESHTPHYPEDDLLEHYADLDEQHRVYASVITGADRQIGRVLDAIAELGLEENTLVVFTSDQGSHYGQHGLWGNSSASWPFITYNENMQIPLIFRQPGQIQAGTETDLMVNQFDFLPTLLDYLGLAAKEIENSPGKSFAAALSGDQLKYWDNTIFYEYITARVIRTERWKYQKAFLAGEDQLYDLDTDPGEKINLADNPDYAEIKKDLDNQLTRFFDQYADPRYDLWHGGTAKLRLLDAGQNSLFADQFPDWQPPVLSFESSTFSDLTP